MEDLGEIIVSQATDPKVAFMAAALFGYCLYKLMIMTKGKSPQTLMEDSDETDDENPVYIDDNESYKMILVVRTDLKMGKGKVAAQCSHAAVAAYKSARKYPEILRAWEKCGQPKIILKVDSEAGLVEIAKQAKTAGLLSNVIQDAGHTQIPAGSKTVCAVGPGPEEMINVITGDLKLF